MLRTWASAQAPVWEIHRQDSGEVAAWYVVTDETILVYRNDTHVVTMGDENYVTAWFRLNAYARRKPFGVLLASALSFTHHLASHTFETLVAFGC